MRDLFRLLEPHFGALDAFLRAQVADFEPEIRDLALYCLDTSGKRIRPALVFFSGWESGGAVSEPLVRVAAVIEMVHLATLVHDDIMDEADVRRGRRTVSRAHGPDAAVLLGDALFAHALSVASQFPTTEVCRHVSVSTRRVCAGEIMQTLAIDGDGRGAPGLAPETELARYRRIIDLKTAELFSVSCFLGARLRGAGSDESAAAGAFGRRLGTAYQIYDDLADFFGREERIGKTLGTDLRSGKRTLPLLLLGEKLPPDEADELRREIATGNADNFDRRVAQMAALGVFSDAMDEIRTEMAAGLAALGPAVNAPSGKLFRQLAELLEAQALSLHPGTGEAL